MAALWFHRQLTQDKRDKIRNLDSVAFRSDVSYFVPVDIGPAEERNDDLRFGIELLDSEAPSEFVRFSQQFLCKGCLDEALIQLNIHLGAPDTDIQECCAQQEELGPVPLRRVMKKSAQP